MVLLLLGAASALHGQGSVGVKGFASLGGTTTGTSGATVSHTLGMPFSSSMLGVSEGVQQTLAIDLRDSLLMLAADAEAAGYQPGYVPGSNDVQRHSSEGYDENLQLYVYKLTCTSDLTVEMPQSGHPTMSVLLDTPSVTPDGSAVSITLDRSNPYNYPIGTTPVVWTATLESVLSGIQTANCTPNITVNPFPCPVSVSDVESNSYNVVPLGYYCWTGRNHVSELYSDNSAIPDVKTYTSDESYPFDILATFGHLYTWNAATKNATTNAAGFMPGICPTGWHIPNQTESEYLLANFDSPDLMSAGFWLPTGGSNSTGFGVLPAGFYNSESGYFENLLVKGFFWTTQEEASHIIVCEFGALCGSSDFTPALKESAYSVRCVLDYE